MIYWELDANTVIWIRKSVNRVWVRLSDSERPIWVNGHLFRSGWWRVSRSPLAVSPTSYRERLSHVTQTWLLTLLCHYWSTRSEVPSVLTTSANSWLGSNIRLKSALQQKICVIFSCCRRNLVSLFWVRGVTSFPVLPSPFPTFRTTINKSRLFQIVLSV
jgi:hypothetical protein